MLDRNSCNHLICIYMYTYIYIYIYTHLLYIYSYLHKRIVKSSHLNQESNRFFYVKEKMVLLG